MNPSATPRDERDPQPLAAWLRELRWALAALPERDRDEIVAEARSHLLDRSDAGTPLASALAALGAARDYARPFLDEYRQSAALTHGRLRDLLPLVAERLLSSARAGATLAMIVAIWIPALLLASTAAVKLVHPELAGLWVGPSQRFLGTIDDPSQARELLGVWIFPLAAVALVAAWLLTRRLASSAVRRLASRT